MNCETCNQPVKKNNYIVVLKSKLNIFGKLINFKLMWWFVSGNLETKLDENLKVMHTTCYLEKSWFERVALSLPLAGGLTFPNIKEIMQNQEKHVIEASGVQYAFLTQLQYKVIPFAKIVVSIFVIISLLNSNFVLLNFFPTLTYILLGLAFILVTLESIALYKAHIYAQQKLESV